MLRIALFFLLFTVIRAQAEERRVLGEDIVQTGQSQAESSEMALFKAQAAAVRALVVECGSPHRDTKIWAQEVTEQPVGFAATVKAGMTFSQCSEAKHATGDRRKLISNPVLVRDQALYDRMLKKAAVEEEEDENGKDSEEPNELTPLQKAEAAKFEAESQRQLKAYQAQAAKEARENPVVEQPEAPPTPCQLQANALLSRATMAATHNTPPGNMAQGEAAILMNQAEQLLRSCK